MFSGQFETFFLTHFSCRKVLVSSYFENSSFLNTYNLNLRSTIISTDFLNTIVKIFPHRMSQKTVTYYSKKVNTHFNWLLGKTKFQRKRYTYIYLYAASPIKDLWFFWIQIWNVFCRIKSSYLENLISFKYT